MIIPNEINDAFYAGDRSDEIKFVINDTVLITKGEFEGKEAAVISIESLEPFFFISSWDFWRDWRFSYPAVLDKTGHSLWSRRKIDCANY